MKPAGCDNQAIDDQFQMLLCKSLRADDFVVMDIDSFQVLFISFFRSWAPWHQQLSSVQRLGEYFANVFCVYSFFNFSLSFYSVNACLH